jgi:hypothetical protein
MKIKCASVKLHHAPQISGQVLVNAVTVQVKPVRSQAPGILPIGISRLAAVDSSPTREG